MTLKARWMEADGQRTLSLDIARECAQLTKPWVLTQRNQRPEVELPASYQNIGADGVTNLTGMMLAALFPPEVPWMRLDLNPAIRYSPHVPPEALQLFEEHLFQREMLFFASLESGGSDDTGNRYMQGFQSAQTMALTQINITGETLMMMDDDFRFTVYRRDQYVTKRDSCCAVQFHGIRQSIDPLSLSRHQIEMAELNYDDLREKQLQHREKELFTFVEWQPWTKTWVIRQECNDKQINESEERISPFYSVPFELVPGENYAHSFIESKKPDLRILNESSLHLIDWVGIVAKAHPVLDYSSEVRESDLSKESGKPFRARVEGGQVQDVAFFHSGSKLNDISFVASYVKDKEASLGRSMLIGSESVRKSERTTAFEVARITINQIQGALGGFYTPLADALQLPIVHRGMHILEKKNILPKMPKGAMSAKILTGVAALQRENKASAMLDLAQVAQMLGPEALAKIDPKVFIDVYSRLRTINEPALIKSNEQLAQEQQAANANLAQQQATEKGLDVAGNVAQAAITPQQIS